MGFLDFLTRRTRSKGGSREDAPRCDHYSFAHVVLRDAAFQNPVQIVSELASAESATRIAALWGAVEQTCKEHKEPVTLSPDDILTHTVPIDARPCVLVEMPAAARKTEAFFVAVVLRIDLNNREAGFDIEPLRYLTLEFSATNSIDEVQTVIGEWHRDGTHHSLGPGPEPDIAAFVASVEKILAGRKLD
jgi:hypothetical protein